MIQASRKMSRADAEQFYKILSQDMPSPETELNYHDPFTLLIAVVLSAQATDVGVNKATAKLFPVASTPEAILALGEEKLGTYIKTIGLWRNKAKNVIALCRMLIDEHNGIVPDNRDSLEKLPGVGRKTANVVCNVVFGQPTIAVDTHIFRIGNRTGLAPGKTPLLVEKGLEKITPEAYLLHAHHWLILHGRYICKARTPECYRCSVVELCKFKDKTPDPATAKTQTLKSKTKRANQKQKISLASKPKLRTTRKKKASIKG